MNFMNRSSKLRTNRQPLSGRKLAPMIEVMESRQLLTTGAGFLTGSVLLDGPTGAPVSGVTIQLFNASNTASPVSTQTTGANGQYLFTGLQSGDYLLKEVAPTGYMANGANAVSQLNPASAVGYDTIKVSVVDPSKVFVNYGGIASGSYSVVNAVVNGNAQVNSVGPQADTLGTSAGATDLNAGFHTFCVNDQQSLSFAGGEQYQVAPRPITDLTNGSGTVSTDHAGRIAYLFNHYGNSSLTNVQGAGLQLAIWELLYDNGNTPDFTSGSFQVPSLYRSVNSETLTQVLAQAQSYFNESTGKSETAVFLDATPYTCSPQGIQSVLATESLNFSVHKADTYTCCDLTNVHYVINGCKTVTSLGGNVHAGDTVEADFTVPCGETDTVSLVSYNADCSFSLPNQTVSDYQTQTYGPGCHSLTVTVPKTYFQVDFVCGDVITHFNPGAGITYHGENRFMDADHGGPATCAPPVVVSSCDNHDNSVCDTGSHHSGCDDNHRGSVCNTDSHRSGSDDNHRNSICDTGSQHTSGGDDCHRVSVCDTGSRHDSGSGKRDDSGKKGSGGSSCHS